MCLYCIFSLISHWLQDFVVGLSNILRGTVTERLCWAFSLYDLNKDGCITKEVLHVFYECIFKGILRFI